MTSPLPLDPAVFIPEFDAIARQAGFNPIPYGEICGHPLLAYTKRSPGRNPRVYLSAGIHGDEPAPPWALLELMESGYFDAGCTWFICPLLNPTGFIHRTRENDNKVDLNRDYKGPQSAEIGAHLAWLRRQPNFDLVICLHEDWESQGFYLYELNRDARPTLAPAMIEAARPQCPIESATRIDDRPVTEPGIIRPANDPLLRESWPEAIYLWLFHCRLVYTIETPSTLPPAQRVATHGAVVREAIDQFLQ